VSRTTSQQAKKTCFAHLIYLGNFSLQFILLKDKDVTMI